MVAKRGDIWWANLPEPVGSGPGYARPVLVVQSDRANASELNTIIVAIITRSIWLAEAEGNVFLTSAQSGLPHDSVVNVSQLFTIDETILREYVSSLSLKKVEQVNNGLRKILAL